MRKLRILTAFLLLSSVVMAQSRQLTGTVTDSKSGSGLPAATIGVKGKTAKTAAGPDGSFSLTVPAGNISLEVTSVGYGTKTILVEGDKTISQLYWIRLLQTCLK
jgi:hypothetical protein